MPVPVDPFDFTAHTDAIADQVDARFKVLYDHLDPAQVGIDNSNISAAAAILGSKLGDTSIPRTKLDAALAASVGVNDGAGILHRGSKITPATEARAGAVTVYDFLPTPDVVNDIDLPNGGLIGVWFHAFWSQAVAGAARAAIFLNSNQLSLSQVGSPAPGLQETVCAGAPNIAQPLSSTFYGLNGWGNTGFGIGHTTPATTGQAIALHNLGNTDESSTNFGGGPCWIFADPGTYDVGVKFKASTGNVSALNRRLYVVAFGF